MKAKDIKKKINNEMECLISSDFDSVISKIENKKGVIIEMERPKRNTKVWGLSLSLAAIILVFAGIFGINYFNKDTVNLLATIILDVNPSLEIKVNEEEKIIDVITHNDEAKEVIGDMDLKGVDLDVGTNAILGAMLKHGYIDEAKNSILVTVTGSNETKNKELQERVAKDIDEYFSTSDVSGSVMSQTVSTNQELESLAQKYNITIGKAELINKIVAANPMYSFEDLVNLSTTELNILANSSKNNVTSVTTSGTASEKQYIGKDKAKEIVLNKLGIKENKVSKLEIELDLDNGVMVYDIEFYYNGYEYDYEVNAVDGTIIKSDKDKEHNYEKPEPTQNTTSGYISKTKAKEIALNHAKVTDYYDYDIEFDYENGVAVYEIDFETDTKEYEYVINAKTGNVIFYEVESEDDTSSTKPSQKPSSSSSSTSSSLISKGKAKTIALNHAGVTNYYDYDVELDTENGIKVYEIDFETKDYEYEYEINAKTGKIIKSDKERKDLDD